MKRKEFTYRMADYNEAEYDIQKEIKEVKFKLFVEDDPNRKNWFQNALDKLKGELEQNNRERAEFSAQYSNNLED